MKPTPVRAPSKGVRTLGLNSPEKEEPGLSVAHFMTLLVLTVAGFVGAVFFLS